MFPDTVRNEFLIRDREKLHLPERFDVISDQSEGFQSSTIVDSIISFFFNQLLCARLYHLSDVASSLTPRHGSR